VEFLDFNEAVKELKAMGVVDTASGDHVRFGLEISPPHVQEVHEVVLVSDGAEVETGENARRIDVSREALPELTERLIHGNHMTEVVLVPVSSWKAIIDLVAFDLATDETWLEIDAEASLHQNTHDPLFMGGRELHLVKIILTSLLASGESPESDLLILAVGSPMVFQFQCNGVLKVVCPNAAIADEMASSVRS